MFFSFCYFLSTYVTRFVVVPQFLHILSPSPFFFLKSLFSLLSSFRGLNCDLLKLRGRRQWQPTPVLFPRKSHGQRSLVGYSRWGCKESDTTKQLHFTHFTHFILYHWRRKWQPIPVFLSAKSHGQRSLAGHGPWGRREMDTAAVSKHEHMHYDWVLLTS